MVAGDDSSTDLEQATAEFIAVRGRLFGIAYRMLGSSSEAEDIVQEAWLRWQTADRSAVVDPAAFLATTTTRLCLNALQSARARRETYVGPWLPEPVDTSADPHLGAERGEALELATVMLMEKLQPTERAAYVLREAFDYPYARIAEIVQVKEANARQLVSRARKHIDQPPGEDESSRAEAAAGGFGCGSAGGRRRCARATVRRRRGQLHRRKRHARRISYSRCRQIGGRTLPQGIRAALVARHQTDLDRGQCTAIRVGQAWRGHRCLSGHQYLAAGHRSTAVGAESRQAARHFEAAARVR